MCSNATVKSIIELHEQDDRPSFGSRIALALVGFLAGCDQQDMVVQPKFRPLGGSFFADARCRVSRTGERRAGSRAAGVLHGRIGRNGTDTTAENRRRCERGRASNLCAVPRPDGSGRG